MFSHSSPHSKVALVTENRKVNNPQIVALEPKERPFSQAMQKQTPMDTDNSEAESGNSGASYDNQSTEKGNSVSEIASKKAQKAGVLASLQSGQRENGHQTMTNESRVSDTSETSSEVEGPGDVFLDIAREPSLASSFTPLQPMYQPYLDEMIEQDKQKGREVTANRHVELAAEAEKKWFDKGLKREMDRVGHFRQELEPLVRKHCKERSALQTRLYKVLGSYSYFLIQEIRYELRYLSKQEKHITSQISQELGQMAYEMGELFEVFKMSIDNKSRLSNIIDLWAVVDSIEDRGTLETALNEVMDVLEKSTPAEEEVVLRAKRALFEKRLKISERDKLTRGGFTELSEALRKLSEERGRILENSAFATDDMVQKIYVKADNIRQALPAPKVGSSRSTKEDTSTVHQEAESLSARVRRDSHQSNELKPSGGPVDKVLPPLTSPSTKKPATSSHSNKPASLHVQVSRASHGEGQLTKYKAKHRQSSQGSTLTKHRRNNSLPRRVEGWRERVPQDNSIDALCTRLSSDIEAFLVELSKFEETDQYQKSTIGRKTLERKLDTLRKEIKPLSSNRRLRLWKSLQQWWSRLGVEPSMGQHFLYNDAKTSQIALDYLSKSMTQLSLLKAGSHPSRHRSSSYQPADEKQSQLKAVYKQEVNTMPEEETRQKASLVVEKPKPKSILKSKTPTTGISSEKASHLPHPQIGESSKMSGLVVQNNERGSRTVGDTPSECPSIRTRSYRCSETEWESATTSNNSHQSHKSVSTIRPKEANKPNTATLEAGREDKVVGHREHTKHKRVRSDEKYTVGKSKRSASRREVSDDWVILTQQSNFLWFKIGHKQVEMSGKRYERVYGGRQSLTPIPRI